MCVEGGAVIVCVCVCGVCVWGGAVIVCVWCGVCGGGCSHSVCIGT